ncbi:hypothetical protein DAPPUDRAFT_246062 [Daphnia pulex]|uniref:C1q domain-containing protein n=1 Tax=Daphnia pulex TaxID=6669 RepID=E9GPK3_DAPPU|nr:hypothetical protein DAPPUDRAFT_246062 [Daphnia pulex]|eukprot:EFX78654.1 hypothetical protein DAPPUDRAFT_246062 [Daphnia pulex]
MPTSCEDIWSIGHTLSGIYSVKGVKIVENVNCNFENLPKEAVFQKWIGYDEVKVGACLLLRLAAFNTANVSIPFQVSKLNIGNAMDLSTGKFTTPVQGTYFFSFTGHASSC